MSSRALRKLQKEQEQQKQLQGLNLNDDDAQVDESGEEQAPASKAQNVFDMLDDGGEQDQEDEAASGDETDEEKVDSIVTQGEGKLVIPDVPKAKTKTKKKKNKKKGKSTHVTEKFSKDIQSTESAPHLDEIDLALQSLSTNAADDASESTRVKIDEANSLLYRLLAVESKHLNALNEMKRLFGNVVMESEGETAGPQRRRGRGPQQLDLGGALAGRNNLASRGQGLAGLALRRNPFILGKEEWPKATSGGLGMEMVEKLEDGTIEFRFVHNTLYQDVQRQFEVCVESMDPQRMITMLQYNPYHVSTLLQVSEIAKQQGDHSVSGDLLERALFSFGRSVHSSFTTALSEGKARLDFRRPENREFWLAAWRYTNNLGQKGTWRTAYEWTKLILSLDPEGDPYCIGLVIDQIALRGGQSEHFVELSHCQFFRDDLWASRVNIPISTALAEYKSEQAQKSRESLIHCISAYPWVFARLFKALNIDHVPRSIWGKAPKSERAKFECELYVHNAKDLWNTPETVSFLVEVAESVETPGKDCPPTAPAITLEEARHVLLSGIPTLINLIPRSFTTRSSSSSDPLPPDDNLPSYSPAPPEDHHREYASPFETTDGPETPPNPETPNPRSPADNEHGITQAQHLYGAAGFFRRMLPFLSGTAPAPDPAQVQDALEDEQRRAAEQGVPPELTGERGARVMSMLERIMGGDPNESEEQRLARRTRLEDFLERPPHDAQVEQAQAEASTPNAPALESAPDIGPPEPYDDERNQRWLAGQGMLRLKDFTTQHGTDESAWAPNSGQDIVTEYARRMLQLRQARQRTFLMDFTLRQGTSGGVRDLVGREMERLR